MIRLDKLYAELKNRLEQIARENKSNIRCANLSVFACEETLLKMNKVISESTFRFRNEKDEIHFFKNIKTYPLQNLIYFMELRSFELLFPKIGKREQKRYIKKSVKKINRFFQQNIPFLQYTREERNDMDALFFTRANNQLNSVSDPSYYRSPEFSTSHDIILGKIKAYDLFIGYLKEKMMTLQYCKVDQMLHKPVSKKLQWTASKVALTELIYALYHTGAINYGKADVKEITTSLRKAFHIEIDDVYKIYSEIKLRKKSRTKFLDELAINLLSGIERSE